MLPTHSIHGKVLTSALFWFKAGDGGLICTTDYAGARHKTDRELKGCNAGPQNNPALVSGISVDVYCRFDWFAVGWLHDAGRLRANPESNFMYSPIFVSRFLHWWRRWLTVFFWMAGCFQTPGHTDETFLGCTKSLRPHVRRPEF